MPSSVTIYDPLTFSLFAPFIVVTLPTYWKENRRKKMSKLYMEL